jgi:hypothetical protein
MFLSSHQPWFQHKFSCMMFDKKNESYTRKLTKILMFLAIEKWIVYLRSVFQVPYMEILPQFLASWQFSWFQLIILVSFPTFFSCCRRMYSLNRCSKKILIVTFHIFLISFNLEAWKHESMCRVLLPSKSETPKFKPYCYLFFFFLAGHWWFTLVILAS